MNVNGTRLVREAEVDDGKSLEELYSYLHTNNTSYVSTERIDEFKQSSRDFVFVAEVDGIVVGTASLNVCLSAEMGSAKYGVIGSIAVSDSFRFLGVGKMLLEHVEYVAKENNCANIVIVNPTTKVGACKFFKKAGFDVDTLKGFRKSIEIAQDN